MIVNPPVEEKKCGALDSQFLHSYCTDCYTQKVRGKWDDELRTTTIGELRRI